jgi:glycosyltransferase involved in cell wall biosynthesis
LNAQHQAHCRGDDHLQRPRRIERPESLCTPVAQPLISVCIPAYNNGKFIAATLKSVLVQTYSNLEVIVTDDDSADETVSVVTGFADPRIKLFQNEANLGVGVNWNKALSLAKGKYVKVMGADDLLYPDCVSLQMQALENSSDSGAVLAVCNSDVIDANAEIVLRRRFRFRPGLVSGERLIRNSVRWGTNLIGEPVVGLFKRDVLSKSGMFDPADPYMIDLAFWAEFLKHGAAFMDESRLAAFRISASAVSTKVGLKQAAHFRSFIRKMRADPVYRASRLDVILGCFLSFQWCILRNLLIKFQPGTTRRNR